MYECKICNKEFQKIYSLVGHKRIHGNSQGSNNYILCCCVITKREITVKNLKNFQSNIKYCHCCNKVLDSNRKYCNTSCSAKITNIGKIKSIETKNKIRLKLEKPKKSEKILNIVKIKNSYSKLYNIKCYHCELNFLYRNKKKYCVNCSPFYDENSRNRFKFKFNVYKFPDLFDLNLINEKGWYSRGGKAGKWNPNGLSRDHKLSVSEAIKNNYDSFYITHPMNCEIMTWEENNKKKTNSSISYDYLIKLVDNYENKKFLSSNSIG